MKFVVPALGLGTRSIAHAFVELEFGWEKWSLKIDCIGVASVHGRCARMPNTVIFQSITFEGKQMPGPIRTAKKFSEFESNNKLAEALIAAYPKISWGEKHRSLGNKIGDLDKGVTTWWRNNPDKARCLAELLELSLEDLGLHEKSAGTAFYFLEFPELPPLDFKRDESWQIAYEELDTHQVSPNEINSKPKMEFWFGGRPTLDWRQPTSFDWLWVSDDLHRRLLSRKLSTSGRYEVVFTETLAGAENRLANPKPVIVVVEQDGGGDDLDALAERPTDAGVLVIAPFMLSPREATSSAESRGWEARTIQGKASRIFDLSAKHWSGLDAIKRALRRFHTVDIRVAEAGAGTLA